MQPLSEVLVRGSFCGDSGIFTKQGSRVAYGTGKMSRNGLLPRCFGICYLNIYSCLSGIMVATIAVDLTVELRYLECLSK